VCWLVGLLIDFTKRELGSIVSVFPCIVYSFKVQGLSLNASAYAQFCQT